MYLPKVNAKVIMPVHDLMHRYEPSFPEVKCEYHARELVYKLQAKCAIYILTDSKLGKEAMALGCPVAVSNKYAMPEQVGGAGLLFNPDMPEKIADCIRKL